MTDKEKIRAFTKERFIRNMVKANTRGCLHTIAANEDKELLEFIDSMKKEPVSEDLEKAAHQYAKYTAAPPSDVAYHFVSGANWQKEQMMKGAIKADVNTYECVGESSYAEFIADLPVSQFRKDDKVKLIIIKEAEK